MYSTFIFLVLALASADVYRWTDANGITHYSDRPQPGSERITITVSRPAASSPAASGPSASLRQSDDGTPGSFANYQSLTVTSPAQEQVLWNIEGQLEVAAAVQPPLQPGHALQFSLDGRTATAEPGGNRTRFTEVFRGEHSLQVSVVDAEGRTLATSPTTRFFVRQATQPAPIPPTPAPTPPRRP